MIHIATDDTFYNAATSFLDSLHFRQYKDLFSIGAIWKTDEFRLSCGRVRIRRLHEERRNPQHFVEHTHHTVGIVIWIALAYGSRSFLVFIRRKMTTNVRLK